MILNGFTYNRIDNDAPVTWNERLTWLVSQPPKHLYNEFEPQPWEQLAKVLHETGHKGQAARFTIAKEDHLRRKTDKIKWYVWPFHFIFGKLVGYGHTPSRLVAWMVAIWFICGVYYYWAASEALFGPSNPLVFNNPKFAHCAPNALDVSTMYNPDGSREENEKVAIGGCALIFRENTLLSARLFIRSI